MEEVEVTELRDDFGKPLYRVKSDKFKAYFEVYKQENGYSFFGIRSSAPNMNPALEGSWTSPKDAIRHLISFIQQAKPSVSVMRDKKYEETH